MFIVNINYKSGDKYLFLCSDWVEVRKYFLGLKLDLPIQVPVSYEFFAYAENLIIEETEENSSYDTIFVMLANHYSMKQIEKYVGKNY